MKPKAGWTSLILAMAVAGTQVWACAANTQAVRPINNIQRLAPLISYVKASGTSVWIEYHATCAPSGSENMPLDLAIRGGNEQGRPDPVAAVRELVNGDKGISVSPIRPGLVGLASDDVWSSVFQAKLVGLNLEESDRYNPQLAMWAGIDAADVSLTRLRATPVMKFGGLSELPVKGHPHLKASTRYATLGDLLDDVTRTFGGILVYRECLRSDGTHLFDIDFYRRDRDYDFRN
jgi:hypothetical protein